MMAGIRGKNTKPEILIRHALHKLGFRSRLHDKSLPGKPDLVFPKYRAVILLKAVFGMDINAISLSGRKQEKHFGEPKLQALSSVIQKTWSCTRN